MSPYCLIKRDMAYKQVLLTMNNQLYRQAKAKSKKKCYKNIQEYLLELVRRDLFVKRAGGRPVAKTSDERLMDIISKPTAKTRKIENWARKVGL